MNSIPAQEIKRRGISAADAMLAEGPVHVIKNNRPDYVVLTGLQYRTLLEEARDGQLAHIRAALEDVKEGRVRRYETAAELLADLPNDEE
jgi:PHD/YefM family antitoxin component YafN of YafNO toxin-antitoxin module